MILNKVWDWFDGLKEPKRFWVFLALVLAVYAPCFLLGEEVAIPMFIMIILAIDKSFGRDRTVKA